jgi:hypothetical protein
LLCFTTPDHCFGPGQDPQQHLHAVRPPATRYPRLVLADLPSPSRVGLFRIRRIERFHNIQEWRYAWTCTQATSRIPGTR